MTTLLIDGNALMHRAYHAIPPFKTKDGIPTNAVYGFFSILSKAIIDFHPGNLIICFDTPKPTFRNQLYKAYQAHRPKIEDDFKKQIPYIKEGLDLAGITRVEKDGFEGDDILGTVANKLSNKGEQVLILSGDRDILQLVKEKILVVTPQLGFSKTKIYDEYEVEKKFGVKPKKIPDLKSLAGDPSDNYPGAKGIGPKTAAKLINQWHSVENLLEHVNDIKEEKIRKILLNCKDDVNVSKQLAQISINVDLKINFNKTKFTGFNQKLKEFLLSLEMYSLTKRLFQSNNIVENNKQKKEKEVNNDQINLF